MPSPSQRVSFLGTVIDCYRVQLSSADDSNCLSGASHDDSAPRGFLQGRYRPSTQSFPENAGPYGSGFSGTSVGSASHATNPVMAEAEGSIHQQGLGNAVRKQTDLRSLVREGVGHAHQLPGNASCVPSLSILPAGHMGTPCASTLRQQVRGVIHKSPGRTRLEANLHGGEWPFCVGSDQSVLTEGDACAWQDGPRSGHVLKEQRLLRGIDAPPARGSEDLGELE